MAMVIRRMTRKDGKAKGTLRKTNLNEAIRNGTGNIIYSNSNVPERKQTR